MNEMAPIITPLNNLLAKWQLRLVQPKPLAETSNSIIYKVQRRDGTLAVLKDIKANTINDEALGGAMMQWYGKGCAAEMYEYSDTAQLMEYLEGSQLLDRYNIIGEEDTTDIISGVVLRMHGRREAAPPPGLTPLSQRFNTLHEQAHVDMLTEKDTVFIRASELADKLIESQSVTIPLHGDLHHENILETSGHGWKVIDPKGLLGDPAYEFGNIYCNPLGRPDVTLSTKRILDMTRRFFDVTGYNEQRILSFGAVHAALSATWSLSEGDVRDARARMDVAEQILALV